VAEEHEPTPADASSRSDHAVAHERTLPSPALADGIDTQRVAAALRQRIFGTPADPPRIGRYVVVDRLGAGGMGIVYRAYDGELDRRVAIKLVLGDASADAQQRLGREAQAIARISHPNVVGVYDVGMHEGRVYVAMEYVQGQTLRSWMGAPRSWREIAGVFALAARGLAAAHDGGVVHRDFKPDNVLLGTRGEVKVVDFGLALAGPSPVDEALAETLPSEDLQEAIVPTSLAGTPAYMSPEQFAGMPLDARSDQFGFCVALFEALWGQRPFVGASLAQLAVAVQSAHITLPPEGHGVPRWLEAIVVRGLAADPARRWASMHAVADALSRDPARQRRARALGIGALLAAVMAGGVGVRVLDDANDPCGEADLHMRELWTPARADDLRRAWLAMDASFAADAAVTVVGRLAVWAEEWAAAARDNCEATYVRGEQSAELLDMRSACLRDRASNFGALVDVLERGGLTAVVHAARAVGELPGLAACADPDAVRSRFPPPRDPAGVERVRDEITSARARLSAMPDDAARAEARALVDTARALDYPPVLLEALLLAARDETDPARASADYDRAFWIAAELHDETGQYEAALGAAYEDGALLERVEAGLVWLRHARASAHRGAMPLRKLARIEAHTGTIHLRAGRYREAVVHQAMSVALVEADPGAEPLLVAAALVNLAVAYTELGAPAQAEPLLERALDVEESVLGPHHPDLAPTLIDLGTAVHARGDLPRARALFERAIAVLESSKSDAPALGMALSNLATILGALGDDEEALRRLRQALALFERTLGPDHIYVAMALTNTAMREPPTEARLSIERALAIYESHDPQHPGIAYALNQLADLHSSAGRPELALVPAERALAVRENKLGPTHPDVAWSLHVVGDTLLSLGRVDEAIPRLERALAIREGIEGTELLVARTRFLLGVARWQSGDRAAGAALIDAADPVLRGGTSSSDLIYIARLDEWRAEHR
jgi:tetratricopeptide (TPR) repeat protein